MPEHVPPQSSHVTAEPTRVQAFRAQTPKRIASTLHVEYRPFAHSDWFQTGCLPWSPRVHTTCALFSALPTPTNIEGNAAQATSVAAALLVCSFSHGRYVRPSIQIEIGSSPNQMDSTHSESYPCGSRFLRYHYASSTFDCANTRRI